MLIQDASLRGNPKQNQTKQARLFIQSNNKLPELLNPGIYFTLTEGGVEKFCLYLTFWNKGVNLKSYASPPKALQQQISVQQMAGTLTD